MYSSSYRSLFWLFSYQLKDREQGENLFPDTNQYWGSNLDRWLGGRVFWPLSYPLPLNFSRLKKKENRNPFCTTFSFVHIHSWLPEPRYLYRTWKKHFHNSNSVEMSANCFTLQLCFGLFQDIHVICGKGTNHVLVNRIWLLLLWRDRKKEFLTHSGVLMIHLFCDFPITQERLSFFLMTYSNCIQFSSIPPFNWT